MLYCAVGREGSCILSSFHLSFCSHVNWLLRPTHSRAWLEPCRPKMASLADAGLIPALRARLSDVGIREVRYSSLWQWVPCTCSTTVVSHLPLRVVKTMDLWLLRWIISSLLSFEFLVHEIRLCTCCVRAWDRVEAIIVDGRSHHDVSKI